MIEEKSEREKLGHILEKLGRYPPFGLVDDGDGYFGVEFYRSSWFILSEKEISIILKILIDGTKRVQEYNKRVNRND